MAVAISGSCLRLHANHKGCVQVADLRIGVVLMLEGGGGGVAGDVLKVRVCTLNVTCHIHATVTCHTLHVGHTSPA